MRKIVFLFDKRSCLQTQSFHKDEYATLFVLCYTFVGVCRMIQSVVTSVGIMSAGELSREYLFLEYCRKDDSETTSLKPVARQPLR